MTFVGNQLLIQGIKEMWFVGILDKDSAKALLENTPNGKQSDVRDGQYERAL